VRARQVAPWLALLLLVMAGVAAAQPLPAKPTKPFTTLMNEWTRQLQQAEAYLDGVQQTRAQTESWIATIDALRTEAIAARDRARTDLAKAQELLDALGAPPADDQPPESDEVRRKREEHNEAVTQLRARVTQAELTIARAEQLRARLNDLTLTDFVSTLLAPYPLPYDPATWRDGLTEAYRVARGAARDVLDWRRELSRRDSELTVFIHLLLLTAAAALAGWVLRGLLLRRFGRTADPDPSYTRRFGGAVAEAAARGLIPAALVLMVLQRANTQTDVFHGPVATYVSAVCIGLIVLVLAVSLPRAVLAPDRPDWGLMPIQPGAARALSRWINLLGVLFALDVMLILAFRDTDIAPALRSTYAMGSNLLEGLGILLLVRPALWRLQPPDPANQEAKVEAAAAAPFWPLIRLAAGLVAMIGIIATALGYAALGDYLIKNLVVTGLIVGAVFLLRGVLRELVAFGLRSSLVRRSAGISARGRRLLKFWLRALLDLVLLVSFVIAVLPFWGVADDTLRGLVVSILQGVQIGNVSLSIGDVLLAILVLGGGLVLVRVLRRALAEKLLPETNLDLGVQNSIASGFGYLGVLLAGTMAVATLGIDLSNIALIAGALSVGIGFGLQNVVNNFVSGLILLVERPVKVGDWVVVGANEGFVKKINVRATELQTFQRASVIIPNADLISSSVTNWTHQDRYGRIEVAVGVAYGSDTHKVRDILLEVAAAHDRVLDFPQPFVLFVNFGDSSLDFELRCYTDDVLFRLTIGSDIRFEIDRRFREEGVEIPFPQRVVHMAKPAKE
jgi:small-conductance mechanosensitive channel